jgi:predicted nucleotidyltransferase
VAVEVEDILKTKRQEILRIAAKHGAFDVRVFGSRARGSAGPVSDFDFLIKVGPRHTPWFPGGLVADLEDLLGGKVDVVTEAGLHPLLRDRVLKEAVSL